MKNFDFYIYLFIYIFYFITIVVNGILSKVVIIAGSIYGENFTNFIYDWNFITFSKLVICKY
jgi:hypothetical protein